MIDLLIDLIGVGYDTQGGGASSDKERAHLNGK
jgi:hypothetical protein